MKIKDILKYPKCDLRLISWERATHKHIGSCLNDLLKILFLTCYSHCDYTFVYHTSGVDVLIKDVTYSHIVHNEVTKV